MKTLPTNNLLLQLDHTTPKFQDVEMTRPALGDGNPVRAWVDGRGNKNAVDVSASDGAVPSLHNDIPGFNGVSAVSFTGANHEFDLTGLTSPAGPLTFYCVFSPDHADGQRRILDIVNGKIVLVQSEGTDPGKVGYIAGGLHTIAAAQTGVQVMTWVIDQNGGSVYRDGVLLGSSTAIEKPIGGTIKFIVKDQALGSYALLYIYTEAHDDTQRGEVLDYINEQFGFNGGVAYGAAPVYPDNLFLCRHRTPYQQAANSVALANEVAKGGTVSIPAGTVECSLTIDVSVDCHIVGDGTRLIAADAVNQNHLFRLGDGINVSFSDLILEAPVTTPGTLTTDEYRKYGIDCGQNGLLSLSNVVFENWFARGINGADGLIATITDCHIQGYFQGIAGGDSAISYNIVNTSFGPVQSGGGLHHQLYFNPNVLLLLTGCDFSAQTGGANVHYYGDDNDLPIGTPIFTSCTFRDSVYTCENTKTILNNCAFDGGVLMVQQDTEVNDCTFVNGSTDNTGLNFRTHGAQSVVFNRITVYNRVKMRCEADNASGTLYEFNDCQLVDAEIVNRRSTNSHILVNGGNWQAGELDLSKGSAHLDGGLQMSYGVNKYIHGGILTEGHVTYY